MNIPQPAPHEHETCTHEVRRWAMSFASVVALHGVVVLAALHWPQHHAAAGAPPAAMLIELAPIPTAPASTPTEAPQQVAQAPEEPPPPEPVPEPEPEPPPPEPLPEPPPVEPEVALPAEPPPPPPKPALPEPLPTELPAEKAKPLVAAAPVAVQQAETAATPQQGISALPPANALPDWQGLLLNHLERHKRYPREAQWRRQEGVTYLHFVIDREGKVLEHSIDQSSGYALLDAEVMELIERAQPLPPPPAELPGATLELVVPVQFFVRQR